MASTISRVTALKGILGVIPDRYAALSKNLAFALNTNLTNRTLETI